MSSVITASQGVTGTPPFNPNSEGTKGESSNPKEASDSIEKWANKNIVSKFAITLYFRWILRGGLFCLFWSELYSVYSGHSAGY